MESPCSCKSPETCDFAALRSKTWPNKQPVGLTAHVGPKYGKITSISVIVAQLSVCIASIVFTVEFLDFVFCEHEIASLCHEKGWFLFVSFLISVPIILIENLSCFAYISFMAVVAILSSVITINYYAIRSFADTSKPQPVTRPFNMSGIAPFTGISLFAMEVGRLLTRESVWCFP